MPFAPLDRLNVPVFTTSADGAVTAWSKGMEALTGRGRDSVVGTIVWEVFGQEEPDSPLKQLLDDGVPEPLPLFIPSNHGDPIPVQAHVEPKGGMIVEAVAPQTGSSSNADHEEKDEEEARASRRRRAQVSGIWKSQAVIHFTPQGEILEANDNFLGAMGYALEDVQGQHHRIFMPEEQRETPEYAAFWEALAAGETQSGEFMRIGKGGKEIWIHAHYTPIRDDDGVVFEVVKYAADITKQRQNALEVARQKAQVAGVWSSQAVIHFTPQGEILDANPNFLGAMGYRLDEVQGQHHRMFMPTNERNSHAYEQFWENLAAGQTQSGEFLRVGSGGKQIWIQAHYTPIKDENGDVFEVVKYATDITQQRETVQEVARLIDAVKMGRFDVRAQVRGSKGDSRVLRETVNQMMDAIQKPIEELDGVFRRLSERDLTGRVTGDYDGALGELKQAVNSALDDLATALGRVTLAADEVNDASSEFETASRTVAAGAAQQASSLEETRGSLEGITQQSESTAKKTRRALQLTRDACGVADQGSQAMQAMLESMERIESAADDTRVILEDIDAIAFQTNLLALNAAVEAARAGPAGRCFAIVADEVRNLAKRAKQAAQRTAKKIDQSGKLASDGVAMSREVASSLDAIRTTVSEVTELVERISSSSSEQAKGIRSITDTVGAMDGVVQSSAASAQQGAATAEFLSTRATSLAEMTGSFTLPGTSPATARKENMAEQLNRLHQVDSPYLQ